MYPHSTKTLIKAITLSNPCHQPEAQHTWEQLLNLVENPENQLPHLLDSSTEEQERKETSDEDTSNQLNQLPAENWAKVCEAVESSTIKPINLGSPKFFKPEQRETQNNTLPDKSVKEGSNTPTSSFG